jgi:hypothetical protein
MRNLSINPERDEIGLGFYRKEHDTRSVFESLESVCYGDLTNSVINAPRPSQSICQTEGFWCYLDASPTLGTANDLDGAMGFLEGYAVDSSGLARQNYSFIYAFNKHDHYFITTNQDGYFIFESTARRISLHLDNNGKIGSYLLTQQIYPEDTTVVEVNIDNYTVIENDKRIPVIQDFVLNQNYPNPFNSQTTIPYSLPLSDFIDISIFDISGKKIELLVSGYQKNGRHHIIWDAGKHASGIYFVTLNTSHGILSRKCMLVK